MVKIPTRPSKLIHRLNAIQIKIAARFFFIYSPGQVYSKIYIKIKRTIMAETISEKLSPEPRTRTWKRKFLIPSEEGSGHWVKKEVETWKRRNIIQCKARGRFNLGGNSIAHINSTAQQTVTLATTQHPEFLGLYITALAWIHQTRDII